MPQVVIGMAVTREGIPVRCWTWPGNTADVTTVAKVKADLRGWKLNRVVWAVDRGFVSEENLIELQKGGAHYIAGKKLRSGEDDVEQALSRQGRFKRVSENLEVKEVVVGDGEARKRMVLVRNPAEVARDRDQRERALASIEKELSALPADQDAHSKATCALMSHPTFGRYLKVDKKGRPVIDRDKVHAEERLDGKFLLLTSDDTLDATDVALGYKQLAEVERAWRTLKSELDIRPMYHRLDDRIRAHVLLCWLALLLIRVVEVQTERSWQHVRAEVERVHRMVWEGRHSTVAQCTEITDAQAILFSNLGIDPPSRFQRIEAIAL
jgi:transposase